MKSLVCSKEGCRRPRDCGKKVCRSHISDAVNHPSHYNAGDIEVIDVIEDAGMGEHFCLGNAIKYILRAPHKGTKFEDMKKARWYLDRVIEKYEAGD